jgi:hypothetical protein
MVVVAAHGVVTLSAARRGHKEGASVEGVGACDGGEAMRGCSAAAMAQRSERVAALGFCSARMTVAYGERLRAVFE